MYLSACTQELVQLWNGTGDDETVTRLCTATGIIVFLVDVFLVAYHWTVYCEFRRLCTNTTTLHHLLQTDYRRKNCLLVNVYSGRTQT